MDLSSQTSAQIISEARASLKTVKLSRPITPASLQSRTLWGDRGQDTETKPVSVQRVSRVPFVQSHKRPSSGVRLAPISQNPTPHPPALPSRPSSRTKSAKLNRKSHSLDQIEIPSELKESLSLLERFPGIPRSSWKEDRLKNVLASIRCYLISHRGEKNTAALLDQISDKLYDSIFKIIQALHSSPIINAYLLLLACSVAMVASGTMRYLSSTHLTNINTICQVLFSLARIENNDNYFTDTECTDGMLLLLDQSKVDTIPEYLVYLLGTFKLLVASGNSPSSLTEKYLSIAIPLSTLLMQNSNRDHQLVGPCLLQIAWSLRNLCDSQIALISLTSNETVLLITNMLGLGDETSLYAAKICSKLASNIHFQKSLLFQSTALNNLVSALPLNSDSPLITSRLSYTLSRLVMNDINASNCILSLPNSLISILDTVSAYSHLTSASSLACLSALSSLVGNLALHPEAGKLLSSSSSLPLALISILDYITDNVLSNLEFLKVLLTALNNLTYYQLSTERSQQLTLSLIHLLLLPNILLDTIQQVVSCLGNLTRIEECRTSVRESNTDLFLLTLLESTDTDLLFATTGVLINMTSNSEGISSLLDNGLVERMLGVLVSVGQTDFPVSSHSCQVMWNVAPELVAYSAAHEEVKGQCGDLREVLAHIIASATLSFSEESQQLVNVAHRLLDKLKLPTSIN